MRARGLCLLVALLSGCGYARDRAADAADMFTLEAGVGYGLHVDAKATEYAHLGLGYSHMRKWGLRGRDAFTTMDREVGLPASAILAAGAWRDGNFARLGHLHVNLEDVLSFEDPWRRADLEAGITLGFLQLRVGFSPGHLVDFLAGLVGLDPAGDDRGVAFADPAEPRASWLPGDLHEHCDPPDSTHAPTTIDETIVLARANGLEWVGVTPHFWTGGFTAAARPVGGFAAQMATRTASPEEPIILPGFEMSKAGGGGHAILLLRRPEDLCASRAFDCGDLWLAEAKERVRPRDRLFIPTHPLTRPFSVPYFHDEWAERWPNAALPAPGAKPVEPPPPHWVRKGALEVKGKGILGDALVVVGSGSEGSWARIGEITRFKGADPRAISGFPKDGWRCIPDLTATPFDGLEALTGLQRLGELGIGRTEDLGVDRVFHALDRRIALERRRYVATGGSDNHRDIILKTTWLLVPEIPSSAGAQARRDAVFDALAGGRICVGGDEANSLEARSDIDPRWHAIGADLRARSRVELRWRGTGALVVDGGLLGARKDGFVHAIAAGSFHFYRLEAGPGRRSRSCWIYVNRPRA